MSAEISILPLARESQVATAALMGIEAFLSPAAEVDLAIAGLISAAQTVAQRSPDDNAPHETARRLRAAARAMDQVAMDRLANAVRAPADVEEA